MWKHRFRDMQVTSEWLSEDDVDHTWLTGDQEISTEEARGLGVGFFSTRYRKSNKTNKILQNANDMIALKVARVCRVTKGVDSMVGDGTHVDN